MINKRSIKKLCLAPSTHESAVPGCCRCQGYIQPHILGARAAAALGMHRSSCTGTIPAPGLVMVVSMPELWPFNQGRCFPAWVSQWYHSTRSLLTLPLSLVSHRSFPASTLGTLSVSGTQLLQRCSPAGEWGLLELVSPCLQMLPDILPAPTTLSAPTALPAPTACSALSPSLGWQ